MNPQDIREEIRSILDRYTEEQVVDVLRLVELTIAYNRIREKGLARSGFTA